ncbi:MAG: hypothetical protein LBB80_06495 [Treponema sp.]|nr:hypothetical protein [Treponema sp.]
MYIIKNPTVSDSIYYERSYGEFSLFNYDWTVGILGEQVPDEAYRAFQRACCFSKKRFTRGMAFEMTFFMLCGSLPIFR